MADELREPYKRKAIFNNDPIGCVDLRAFDETGEPFEIRACNHCYPWYAEVVIDPETEETLVREWHAVECQEFQRMISRDDGD